jgi:hypothetical protein
VPLLRLEAPEGNPTGSVIGRRIVVQHDAQKSVVNLQAAVVLDEAQLPELVHEKFTRDRVVPTSGVRASRFSLELKS